MSSMTLAGMAGYNLYLIGHHKGGQGWKTVSQSRAAMSSFMAALTCTFRLSQTTTSGPPSCWCAASGSLA
jgi:hypothetical protein